MTPEVHGLGDAGQGLVEVDSAQVVLQGRVDIQEKLGEFRPHPVLCPQGFVREIVVDQPLHETEVELELCPQLVGIYLGPQLLVVSNQDEVL